MKGASADDIAECCLKQYDQLPYKGTKPTIRSDGKHEWTILAGVVIEVHGDCHCLSFCTGVKALPYTSITPNGDLLHDCHAEVLARRGARLWLLKRLISEVQADDDSSDIDGLGWVYSQTSHQRWSLKAGVKLHLYCSTFPCGDASSSVLLRYGDLDCQDRDFPLPQETDNTILRGRTALSDSRPRLRTKPGKVQSLPSISMSCTDKMVMWSAVGMQGSLFSRWIDPVFFDSLVVGIESLKSASDITISKAVQDCQKILHDKLGQDEAGASKPMKVISTTLSFQHSKEQVQAKLQAVKPDSRISGPKDNLDHVPAAGSIVWIRGEKKEHIIQGKKQGAVIKDKTIPLAPSMRSILSKASFFALVKEAEAVLNAGDESDKKLTYFEAKHSNNNAGQTQYRLKKDDLRGSVSRPMQQEMVTSFLATPRGQSKIEAQPVTSEQSNSSAPIAASSPHHHATPFYGWLVSGEALESFR